MKKKILIIIGGSYVSGLEIITLHLIKGLQERGFHVQCLINKWNDGVFKNKLDEFKIGYKEIKLGWLHLSKPLWTIDSLIHYPQAYFAAKNFITDCNPDIIHLCHYPMTVPLYPLYNCKLVYSLHETHLPTRKHKIIYKLLNIKVDIFTAVSNHIVNVLQHLPVSQDKIRLVYNGIPSVPEGLEEAKTDFSVCNTSILNFGIIGQVAEWKGHTILLKAAELLLQRNIKNFKILIFGNDENAFGKLLKRQMKEKNIESYFVWKGFVKEQGQIYRICDVVIVPSLSEEPCSLTIIESMMNGKGLIVSNRGGNPELVQHQENGLVYSAENSTELSNCMQQYYNYRMMINTFGKVAQQKALAKYSYKRMTDDYIQIYENLLS